MAKRTSLFAKSGGEGPAKAAAVEEPGAAPPAAREAASNRKHPVASTREGKRVATVYLPPEALRQLKRVAADEDTTLQELLAEGVNAVFERRRLSRIA